MSLPHALLVALTERPGTGAELAARFQRSIGYFWQATHQQIYRELGRMEKLGWIAPGEPDPGERRRRVYNVRPAGAAELRAWTAAPQEPPPLRDAFMLRLRAEALTGPTGLAGELDAQAARHAAQLDTYRRIEARDFAAPATSADRLRHLILRAGIDYETARVRICREAAAILGGSDPDQGAG